MVHETCLLKFLFFKKKKLAQLNKIFCKTALAKTYFKNNTILAKT
jgi:hypothetical protein